MSDTMGSLSGSAYEERSIISLTLAPVTQVVRVPRPRKYEAEVRYPEDKTSFNLDVQRGKSTILDYVDEKERKCLAADDNGFNFEDFWAPENDGVMENNTGVCSGSEGQSSMDRSDSETSASSESISPRRKKLIQNIRRQLKYLRWAEYSTYAKDLIRTSKWDSLQNELVSVVSYNVLSQVLLEKHMYLYEKHDDRSLTWESRSKLLLDEFAQFNADILCLQEVDSALVESFYNRHLKEMGYQGVYKQRTNDKLDGCAIYFKKNKFNLVSELTVELYKQSVYLLDRDNIGIILKLSLKSNPESEIVVATTHLLYNPKRGDIKLAQTQLMLAEIEKMAYLGHNDETQQPEYLPIIFTGDMNYSPENGVYQLITKSFLEYEGMSSEELKPSPRGYVLNKTLLPSKMGVTDSCQYASSLCNREGRKHVSYSTGVLGHYLNLESVYDHVKGNLPEATTHQNKWLTVDYIFYSQVWNKRLGVRTEGNLKLISRLTLPNSKEAEIYLRGIPNPVCGSDHLPLMATFQLVRNT